MNDLSKLERDQIRSITESNQWISFQNFAESIIQKFNSESCVSETEWETIKKTLMKEGKVQGVQEFFQEIIKLSNE